MYIAQGRREKLPDVVFESQDRCEKEIGQMIVRAVCKQTTSVIQVFLIKF